MIDYAWYPHSRFTPADVVIANAQDRCTPAKYVYLPARIFGALLAAKEQLRLPITGALEGMSNNASSAFFFGGPDPDRRCGVAERFREQMTSSLRSGTRSAACMGPKPREPMQPRMCPLNRSVTR